LIGYNYPIAAGLLTGGSMNSRINLIHQPKIDKTYLPISIANRQFLSQVTSSGNSKNIALALERSNGLVSVYKTKIFADEQTHRQKNLLYIERLVKTLLWLKGGWKLTIGGPLYITDYLKTVYCPGGEREFDYNFVKKLYEKDLVIKGCDFDDTPEENESSEPAGRNFDGCRIGFDAGGSDRKVSAVIDGRVVFSEEVVWFPKLKEDPSYQYDGIMDSLNRAASKMPRVDAIGVSAAGVYIDNRIMAASLFIKVPEDLFEKKVKNMFLDIRKKFGGVPLMVANDGDVTALAGAMSLETNNVLGIAMGTSEAGGYVDGNGNITGWLNELAFVPVDLNPDAMIDEWSGDRGCGVKYFSQDGIIKLADMSGIEIDDELSPAEKLKVVQALMLQDDARAAAIYEDIGIYLGYSLAYYADFYDMKHVLLMGRVTSGRGGEILVEKARNVLEDEFPELSKSITISLPDENSRRVGQSVAAASLPALE